MQTIAPCQIGQCAAQIEPADDGLPLWQDESVLTAGDVDDLVADYRQWLDYKATKYDPASSNQQIWNAIEYLECFEQFETRDFRRLPCNFRLIRDEHDLRANPLKVISPPIVDEDYFWPRAGSDLFLIDRVFVFLRHDAYPTERVRWHFARRYLAQAAEWTPSYKTAPAVVWLDRPADFPPPAVGITRGDLDRESDAARDKKVEEWRRERAERQAAVRATTITNAETMETDEGTEIEPLPMTAIIDRVRKRLDDWPRRVDQSLFVPREGGVDWLATSASLFGWIQRSVGTVPWRRNVGCVGKEDFFSELRRTAPAYRAVESLPHEPPIDGHFYACQTPAAGDGLTLLRLIERFEPATPTDADLILAATMTALWGGHGGTRPCFVITSDDGRGVGKSKLAEMIGHLVGGFMSFGHNDQIADIKARLLSPDGLAKRVALLDNVKSLRFSWAELEALVTAPIVSGKRMYVGEASRPNTLLWFITLNGASLSTDMAQRSIIIKLKRPARAGTWEEETIRFVFDNREKIIGDLIGCLQAPPDQLARYTRWATWERSVLSRLPDPAEAQTLILERQGEVDVEGDEAELIEEYFQRQLDGLGYATDHEEIFIPAETAARWLNWATGEKHKTITAGRILGQLCDERRVTRLQRSKRTSQRGLVWCGINTDENAPTRNDLLKKISEQIEDREKNK